MGLIGQTWKHCKMLRLLVLIGQNKHTPNPKKTEYYLTQPINTGP